MNAKISTTLLLMGLFTALSAIILIKSGNLLWPSNGVCLMNGGGNALGQTAQVMWDGKQWIETGRRL